MAVVQTIHEVAQRPAELQAQAGSDPKPVVGQVAVVGHDGHRDGHGDEREEEGLVAKQAKDRPGVGDVGEQQKLARPRQRVPRLPLRQASHDHGLAGLIQHQDDQRQQDDRGMRAKHLVRRNGFDVTALKAFFHWKDATIATEYAASETSDIKRRLLGKL